MAETTPAPAAFPSTLWSEVLAIRRPDPAERREKLERLIRNYWRPVYWAIRSARGVRREDAGDLTQEFFIQILEGQVIEGVDPEKGSFRGYLKGALKFFLVDERRRTNRKKRGGGVTPLSIDFDSPGLEPAVPADDPAQALDRAWALHLLEDAVGDLEAELHRAGRSRDAEIFRAFDYSEGTRRPSYAELAARFGVGENEVWNILRACRRRLHECLVRRIGPTVRDEKELFDELRELFGS